MENIYKKIENELASLSEGEKNEILKKLIDEIDAIYEQIVKLLSKLNLHYI
jgi:predicted DNA-binding antitoxin AbrB/MazE fold protein